MFGGGADVVVVVVVGGGEEGGQDGIVFSFSFNGSTSAEGHGGLRQTIPQHFRVVVADGGGGLAVAVVVAPQSASV